MMDVKDKVAFITGGASGLGFAMAKAFVNAGMKVFIGDVSQDHLDHAMKYFAGNPNIRAIRLDVTDREAMRQAADEVERVFGKIHVVCNNAGVAGAEDGDPTYNDWDWMLGVDLGGLINGITTFVPRILKHGEGGHIVNTCSIVAYIAVPGLVYNTAKYAVRGITESLKYSLNPRGIGVSMLCPGPSNTNLGHSVDSRPARFSTDCSLKSDADLPVDQRPPHEDGLEPDVIAERVLNAIQQNQFYIFTHIGYKAEIKGIFDEILAAVPDGEFGPALAESQRGRREMMAKLLGRAK